MDAIDKKILRAIQVNSRQSSQALGEQIGLSATSCQRRLKKLRAAGVIAKEVAVLDGAQLDQFVTILVEVIIKQGSSANLSRFKRNMRSHPAVQQCYYVTGTHDFVLVITASSMLAYEKLTYELFFADELVQKFHSTVVMENVKLGLSLPV